MLLCMFTVSAWEYILDMLTESAVLLSCTILLFCEACVILSENIDTGRTWTDMIDSMMRDFIRKRQVLQCASDFLKNNLLFFAIPWIVGAALALTYNNYLWIAVLTLLLIGYLCLKGINSCKWFLIAWAMLYLIAAGGSIAIVSLSARELPMFNHSMLFQCLLHSILLSILWIFSIGISEHDVGKMATQIINTITTVLLIIVNLCYAYGVANHTFLFSPKEWEIVQVADLYFLVPFVIAGYLAALFKDMQIYWEKRHWGECKKEVEPGSTFHANLSIIDKTRHIR